jgi:hypothetical protein
MTPQKSLGPFAFRCRTRACDTMLRRADLAFTPLWHLQKGGQLQYAAYLNALYVFSLKIPQDAARHLLGCWYDSAENWFRMFRLATAFAELHSGRNMTFPDGTIEFDATKVNIKRQSKKTNTHCGRFLVVVHRETGKYILEPLRDAMVLKGAPPPPERYDEVKKPICRAAHAGHVASSDSAQAFKKVGKDLKLKGVMHATVVHKKKEFSRVDKIPITSLCKRVRKRVAKLPTTTSRTYRMKAGNNRAEATFSTIKRNLRRLNLKSSTTRATINFLSSAWLHKHVGLDGVAKGVAIYQKYIMDSTKPQDAFKCAKIISQLEKV